MKSKIRGLRCFATSDGCVFDYPEDDKEIFEEILYNDTPKNTTKNAVKTIHRYTRKLKKNNINRALFSKETADRIMNHESLYKLD